MLLTQLDLFSLLILIIYLYIHIIFLFIIICCAIMLLHKKIVQSTIVNFDWSWSRNYNKPIIMIDTNGRTYRFIANFNIFLAHIYICSWTWQNTISWMLFNFKNNKKKTFWGDLNTWSKKLLFICFLRPQNCQKHYFLKVFIKFSIIYTAFLASRILCGFLKYNLKTIYLKRLNICHILWFHH